MNVQASLHGPARVDAYALTSDYGRAGIEFRDDARNRIALFGTVAELRELLHEADRQLARIEVSHRIDEATT